MSENKLDLSEHSDLLKLIKIVDGAEAAFSEAGTALATIRDRKLYRQEAKTFEEFCQKHWGYKKSQAYRLIDSAAVAKTSPIGDKIKNEAQARALKGVPASNHAEVLAEAGKTGPLTAKSITKAIADKKLDEETPRVVAGPPIIKDSLGITVPAKALVYWERSGEVLAMMKQLSDIKCAVDKALKDSDKMFVEISNSVLAELSLCRQVISCALSYTVCPTCNGQLVERCALCSGRGIISKDRYQTVPIEIRNMREKMARDKAVKENT